MVSETCQTIDLIVSYAILYSRTKTIDMCIVFHVCGTGICSIIGCDDGLEHCIQLSPFAEGMSVCQCGFELMGIIGCSVGVFLRFSFSIIAMAIGMRIGIYGCEGY